MKRVRLGDSQGRPAGNTQPTPVDAPPTQADTPPTHADDLLTLLSSKVVGQPTALEYIVPSIQLYRSGLAPEGRPVGVFLLLGPTGTGKTRTVEALAEVLHGSPHKVLKVDCGEFQSEHEVAKLIGAPPGYVGHSETRPRLTQQELKLVTSEECDLALVLFDEIEKAAPSLAQLLLGILDRAILRLGDGSMANFEDCLIFLTSNLGARRMMEELKPTLGFDTRRRRSHTEVMGRLEQVGLAAVRKHFSPEFVNRIDSVVTYRPTCGRLSGRDPGPPHPGAPASRSLTVGHPLVRDRGRSRGSLLHPGPRHQRGVRSARDQKGHPPAPHAAPRGGSRQRTDTARLQRDRGPR